ncbi:MAG: hypothetical protein PHH28_12100 [Desulfuromonadaceae bacterium]|nr:hypothetical protein [Desulfuromonadaceae bacterium]
MTHDAQNELQKASLIGRILSMEFFLLVMGVVSLVYGIINSASINIFWGILIILGVFVLHKVRKKDWAKHWQEMEAEHKALEERKTLQKSAVNDARKADTDGK